MLSDNWIEGQIIFIDNFENVYRNIKHEQFEEQRKRPSFQMFLKEMKWSETISEIISDVAEVKKLALFNKAPVTLKCYQQGNAAAVGSKASQKKGPGFINHAEPTFLSNLRVYFE